MNIPVSEVVMLLNDIYSDPRSRSFESADDRCSVNKFMPLRTMISQQNYRFIGIKLTRPAAQ